MIELFVSFAWPAEICAPTSPLDISNSPVTILRVMVTSADRLCTTKPTYPKETAHTLLKRPTTRGLWGRCGWLHGSGCDLRAESLRVKPGSECASPFAAVELKNTCCRICNKISSTDSEHKYKSKSKCWGGRFMGMLHGWAMQLGASQY